MTTLFVNGKLDEGQMMQNRHWKLWLSVAGATCLMAYFPIGAASPVSRNAPNSANQAVPANVSATTTTTVEKQRYVHRSQLHIKRLERDVARLGRDTLSTGDQALRITASNLNIDLQAAKAKMANLSKSTGPVWHSLRDDMDRSLAALDRGVRDLDAKLKASGKQT